MFNQKPTFFHILLLHGFFHVVIIGGLIVAVYSFLLEREHSIIPILYSLFFLLVGCIVLIVVSIKHYRKVISLIEHGYATKGRIIEKYPSRGRGYVVYEYKHHGQIYRGSERLLLTSISKKLKIGQEVTVFTSHESPSQSLLYDLYQ